MFTHSIHYTHFWTVTKNYLSSLNNLFMANFQLNIMSSYAKNKLQMCSVTQHQCRRCQMFGKCSHIQPVHSFLSVTKKDLSWLNNLFMARFQLNRMSIYVKNKLQCIQSLNIRVVVATNDCYKKLHWTICQIRMSSYPKNMFSHSTSVVAMCGKCSKFTHTHFLSVTKNYWVLIEQSAMAMVSTHLDVLLC